MSLARAVRAVALLFAGLLACWAGREPGRLAEQFGTELGRVAAAAEAEGRMVVRGDDGWLFFVPELRHLSLDRFWGASAAQVSRAARAEDADPLAAILDLHRQLTGAGIELLFVPVPAKATIYPEAISEAIAVAPGAQPPRLDAADHAFLDVLAEQGVPVLDLTPAFLAARSADADPLYCRHDTHWSGRACRLAAREIARVVAGRPYLDAAAPATYDVEPFEAEITGDLWRLLEPPRPSRERLRLWRVGERTSQGLKLVRPWRESPVLLLGDSHNLVFHAGGDLHAVGAGLPDHLARELGLAVDLVAVKGSGATPSRVNLLRRRDGLRGKKLVIWCLSVREYTEGQGWKRLPLIP